MNEQRFKAFKKNGNHLVDDTWDAVSEENGSSVHAPIQDAKGVTVALVVARAKSYDLVPDIGPLCHLIAAAPCLLAALQACLPFIDDANEITQFFPESAASTSCREAVKQARAAIARALPQGAA